MAVTQSSGMMRVMQLFLDSADPKEVKQALKLTSLDGLTTNPSLAAKVGRPYKDLVKEILGLVSGPVSLEVIATDYEGMLTQARRLAQLGNQVVVKIPCTPAGLKAVQTLKSEGIKTNVTLVFSLNQALLVGKTGSDYCSPFVGRLNDLEAESGERLIAQMRAAYDEYDFSTQILAASIRSVANVENMIRLGADAATLPLQVLTQLIEHPLTDKGLQAFLSDWKQSGLQLPA